MKFNVKDCRLNYKGQDDILGNIYQIDRNYFIYNV